MPLASAFADMRRRSRQDMPEDWIQRSAAHWSSYLDHHVHEARSRQAGTPMSLSRICVFGATPIGVAPVFDLAERLSSCVLPDHLYALPHLSIMREMTKTFIICDNGIVSLDKDAALGEQNNLVLCLEREHGISRPEAIEKGPPPPERNPGTVHQRPPRPSRRHGDEPPRPGRTRPAAALLHGGTADHHPRCLRLAPRLHPVPRVGRRSPPQQDGVPRIDTAEEHAACPIINVQRPS
ncbi:terpene synthase family protein [Streptomyces inhibens]|uniref:terpene synthase family protein n=1 Tax=Streptomyces inhibens TaxID=2293571 RepID=UPI0036A07C15